MLSESVTAEAGLSESSLRQREDPTDGNCSGSDADPAACPVQQSSLSCNTGRD